VALKPLYLLDKSAWEQRHYVQAARDRISELHRAKQLGLCIVTLTELLYSSRNLDEMKTDHARLRDLVFLPMTEAAEHQVVVTMKALAAKGQHRKPIPDLLLAAVAEVHGAIVLHYDADFERIAAVTGQRHEWIVPRGKGHRSSSTS
jgi:predicted nucleic acid-binding protein